MRKQNSIMNIYYLYKKKEHLLFCFSQYQYENAIYDGLNIFFIKFCRDKQQKQIKIFVTVDWALTHIILMMKAKLYQPSYYSYSELIYVKYKNLHEFN